jgi:hypothetical protein
VPRRLLVVRDAFTTSGPGTVVVPRITAGELPRGTFTVSLVLPGGAVARATASLDVAHVRGPLAPFALVRLVDRTPESVPAGTEVWTVDD